MASHNKPILLPLHPDNTSTFSYVCAVQRFLILPIGSDKGVKDVFLSMKNLMLNNCFTEALKLQDNTQDLSRKDENCSASILLTYTPLERKWQTQSPFAIFLLKYLHSFRILSPGFSSL